MARNQVFHAEERSLKNLRTLAKAAEGDELKQTFETYREETQGQIERVEILGKRVSGVTCEAINGLVKQAKG